VVDGGRDDLAIGGGAMDDLASRVGGRRTPPKKRVGGIPGPGARCLLML